MLQVAGEIDLATVDALQTALEEAFDRRKRWSSTWRGVTFFDATGLRVVLQAAACP